MTPNKEDYLKSIYEIGESQQKITNKLIAETMQVSPPAASEMLKKMISEDWICKDKTSGYLLTPKGQVSVAELYRKHRLLEVFLVNHLHYTASDIHPEAEVLEHTVSTLFIDRLEETLGFPDFCPHGGTIPKKGELLVEVHHQTLAQINQTGHYILSRFQDEANLLTYMETHHLTIHTPFELTQIDNFAGTFTITYKEQSLAIPTTVAKKLYVQKV